MRRRTTRATSALAGLLALTMIPLPCAFAKPAMPPAASHHKVVGAVSRMVSDQHAQALARKKGLQILNVLWEDTGRYKGSSVGPNISDVTIEVQSEDGRGQLRTSLMPVIRFPNFRDKTGDIKLKNFYIRVGNHKKNGRLRNVSLKEFLRRPTRYMSLPRNGRIKGGSLLAKRDKHALVSAQAAFLPIRKEGKTNFWPVIFNYQSTKGHPAVLTLLVTRQGTSMTIIDNSRDTVSGGRSWGQRLYMNVGGKRAPMSAERLSTVKARGYTQNGESAASLGADSNLLMMIQVPLKVKRPRRMALGGMDDFSGMVMEGAPMAAAPTKQMARRKGGARPKSDVEQAVLGHGPTEGKYTELDGLTIERDARFPVRVTVQFYQATSNGVVSSDNVEALAAQIKKVYDQADYVGSLVTPGHSGRPTEYTGAGLAPAGISIHDFPGLVERCIKQGKRCRIRPPAMGIVGVTR